MFQVEFVVFKNLSETWPCGEEYYLIWLVAAVAMSAGGGRWLVRVSMANSGWEMVGKWSQATIVQRINAIAALEASGQLNT